MFLTLLFIVVFFSKKEHNVINHEKYDDETQLLEIDNITNQSHNPAYHDNYFNKVYNELLYTLKYVLIVFCVLLLCIYFDINYIYYIYLGD